ncbi:hypothetical protein [Fictibacillus barbaricus]|uniref:DUF3800 domain-containing protein n=1 Tax=Fictibacillus barbaricus TaxID=182136 RepID=A0ABU1U5J0_9BACL|nr:hypothetical protein [Fictibacillus barbaricus]MDR7074723.1 hypothetical protein [Fictibacillus barbaricus]
MRKVEIWLDESGNFNDENNNRVPSLVGGVVLKGRPFTEICAREILGTTKPLHAAELYEKDLETLVNTAIDKMNSLGIIPIVFENRERVSIIDPQTTYLSVFAEGIMQLISDLNLDEDNLIFDLYIARRMYKKDMILTRMKDEEYISRLMERISLLKIKNPNLNKFNNYKINIQIGSAREDRRLMVADLVCHAWYSKRYKLSQKSQDKLERILEGKVYTILEPGGIASIKQKIKLKALGEGLFEWIGHYHELKQSNNGTKENTSKLLSLKDSLNSKLEKLNRSEKNMQLNILANYIKALVNYNKQFDLAIPYLKIFFEEIVPSLNDKNVDTLRIEAEAHFSLLTTAANLGNVSLVNKEINELELLIRNLSKRWENLDFISEYYIRKGAYLYSVHDYKNSIILMDKLEEMVSGIAEISSSILTDEFKTGGGTINSILLGKVYGVRSQAYLRLSMEDVNYLTKAEQDCYKALKQFDAESDKTRQFQTLAQINSRKKMYLLAEKYIAESIQLPKQASSEAIVKKILLLPLQQQSFIWMHYLAILAESMINGEVIFASERFELIKKSIDIHMFDNNTYPNNIILFNYAICQIYIGEYNQGISNFEKAIKISFNNIENVLMINLGLSTIAKFLIVLNKNNKLTDKTLNSYIKVVTTILKRIDNNDEFPEGIKNRLSMWDSITKNKQLKSLDFNTLKLLSEDF